MSSYDTPEPQFIMKVDVKLYRTKDKTLHTKAYTTSFYDEKELSLAGDFGARDAIMQCIKSGLTKPGLVAQEPDAQLRFDFATPQPDPYSLPR